MKKAGIIMLKFIFLIRVRITIGSANFSEFLSTPYRTVPHRTATDRLSFWKIAQHINEFSVKNAI